MARFRRIASIVAGRLFNITVGATGVAKRKLRGSERPTSWSIGAILLATSYTAGIAPASAAIDLSASTTVGVEHDSNPLSLTNSQAKNGIASGFITGQDDTVKRFTANAAAKTGVSGPTHLELQAMYSKLAYVRFTALDHTEYNLGGNLTWKPSQVFDVSLLASQTRAPVAQNDVGGERIVQQTSRIVSGTLQLRPTPNWQLSLTPHWYDYELPLIAQAGTGNFALNESGGSVGLGYLGVGALVPGLFVTESHGKYSGIDNATRYNQRSLGVSLNYKVTDFSSFILSAGQTKRETHLIATDSPLAGSFEGTQSASTGILTFLRQLSVKTAIHVSAFRNFQPYSVGVNTTVGTGFNAGVTWKATAKLSASFDSNIVWLTISDQPIAGPSNERRDLARNYAMAVNYLVARRVSLRTNVTRTLNNSNVRSGVFDKTIAGLELTVTFD